MAFARARLRGIVSSLLFSTAVGALGACDEAPKQKNPFDPPADKPKEPPPITEPVKPKGPPDLEIDTLGTKVGFARQNFQFPDARSKLRAELAANKQYFENQEARLVVDRKAKPEWVAVFLAELAAIGVPRAVVKTETRSGFPAEVAFTPEGKLSAPPACSVVAMILDDRGTAVWKLGGGVAGKRPKGMAGPDLSMTGDSIERVGKACKTGGPLFVAGGKEIEWGLIYDLAASTQSLDVHFEQTVLVSETPVPDHKVDLAH